MKYKKENKIKIKHKRITMFDLVTIIALGILAIIVVFPFYNVVIISFADYDVIAKSNLYLWPKSFDFTAYKRVLADSDFWSSTAVTVFITVSGVILSMLISVSGAYALAKKELPGRNIIFTMIIFTMFFGGGLIPYYLLMKNLHLVNSIFVMIIPTALNTTYLIIMKNYFRNLPEGLIEAAKIDGAGDLYVLFKIVIPISKPFMATFALFYAVERWNEWWNSLLFINEASKAPLQIYLRNLLVTFSSTLSTTALNQAQNSMDRNIYFPSLQMAAVVIASIPILMVYPFLQKHFAKGIMIGSLKE